MIHSLKIYPKFFEEIIEKKKTFEMRFNDRGFEVGDLLALNEWDGEKCTHRSCLVGVTSVLTDFAGAREGYVVMSIQLIDIYIPTIKEELLFDTFHNEGGPNPGKLSSFAAEMSKKEITDCSDLPKPQTEIRQVVTRTSYDGDGITLEGITFLNDLLKAGAHVVSVVPYYDRKGRIVGNEYLLEIEKIKEKNNDPC